MNYFNRRSLLKSSGIAGLSGIELFSKPTHSYAHAAAADKPNILVIVLDEMRAPQWFPQQSELDRLLPNIARLRKASVSFESHYTASNMCTPSRGAMITGLYSHQTGCLFTFGGPEGTSQNMSDESALATQFPTWGSLLREQGYRTWWWGKWHLGVTGDTTPEGLEAHGFSGGTYPSPNGLPGEGLSRDHAIVDQFNQWFTAQAQRGPWCTTVSLVNPHDIVYWPSWQAPSEVPHYFNQAAPNFESPEDLVAHHKPHLQRDYQFFFQTLLTGSIPTRGEAAERAWARQRDVYLWLQQQVDVQVGRVLGTLASQPHVQRNTIVIFTSDHGEYGGSHGLAGKGAAAYEEAIRVPLFIHDPQGRFSAPQGGRRNQLTSSVDLAPLLLTIATGGNSWRSDPRYAHLKHRADVAAIARNPQASGRRWIAHLTDDLNIEELGVTVPTSAPGHVLAVRTPQAKLAVYSYWKAGTIDTDPAAPVEHELYDYALPQSRGELVNQAGAGNPVQTSLQELINHEVLPEVHAPLPPNLRGAQQQGWENMHEVATARSQLAKKRNYNTKKISK